MLKFIVLGLVLSLTGSLVWADEAQTQHDQWAEPSENTTGRETAARAMDGRLPPLLPGEEVTTGGKTMKVWTSSGSVSVGDVPKPESPDMQGQNVTPNIDDLDIVIDRRGR